ncbi:MAG: hypothetical protein IPH35_18440 [Rhodoferax sp.]|nr:hypothetical protein [Rhodoferax sp.]
MPDLPPAPTFDDVWRTIQELALQSKETERRFQETERLMKESAVETDRRIKEMAQSGDWVEIRNDARFEPRVW